MNPANRSHPKPKSLVLSVAATFGGWLVLSVAHPLPVEQVRASRPAIMLPIALRPSDASAPQPVAITRSSN
ncbi:MAG: hypothetical protein M1546_15495 [Chloroflexi bacterium]|nr:hypothetical protein [Chloroflexota bacterium]